MDYLNKILAVTLISIIALSSKEIRAEENSQELSLKQDRAELDKLRENIPEEVKSENDDLAFILKLFDDKKRSSSKIRQQFNKVFNRNRKKKQKEFKKERKAFTKAEKKQRKAFLGEAKKKRKEFLGKSPSKEEKRDFFADERTLRKEFFSEEKEKRKDFESDMKARRKEFDDFMKDRRKDFDDRMKQFLKDQKELRAVERRQKKALRRQQSGRPLQSSQMSPENKQYLQDFEKIPRKKGHRLQPSDDK